MSRDYAHLPEDQRLAASVFGDAYSKGAYMFEHSRIARNQIEGINMRVHMHAVPSLADDPKINASFDELAAEAEALANDPEAVKEYEAALAGWKARAAA